MARSVAVWLGATLLACLLCAAAYLPPRGVPKWGRVRLQPLLENESRLRARRLAQEWREANAALQGLRYRDQVRRAIAARRAAGQYGPVLIVEGSDSFRVRAEPQLQKGLDTAWARLGLGETKISVAVIARDPLTPSDRGRLARFAESVYGVTYVLPDTVDRTSCLAQGHYPYALRGRKYQSPLYLLRWAETVIGLCAYYARFGVPGPRVEHWLANRHFDLALVPAWNPPAQRGDFPSDPEGVSFALMQWWQYTRTYSFPRVVAACYAGRAASCRQALSTGDAGAAGPRPRAVVPRDPFDPTRSLLRGAEHFLGSVLRQTGAERFQAFWTTSLPVDSALTLALGEPVGDYTARYQRTMGPAPRLGAAARPLDAALGLTLAALVVGVVVVAQGRRQVR